MNPRMRNARITQAVGAVLAVVGGIAAGIGTTSTGLFLFYGVLLVGGLGLIALGRRMYNDTLKG